MSEAFVIAENEAARRVARGLSKIVADCAICVGSVAFLAAQNWTPIGATIYVWRLANLVFLMRLPDTQRSLLLGTLHATAWYHACNSVWPVTAPQAPALVHRFAMDSPLQLALVNALLERALQEGSTECAQSPWCVELDSGVLHAPVVINVDRLSEPDHSPLRHLSLENLGPAILALTTQPGEGMMRKPANDLDAPMSHCFATLRLVGVPDIITLGNGANSRLAAQVTCLEAIERLAGLTSAQYASAWQGSYASLSGPKLDPRECALHLPESYEQVAFPYQSFSESMELDWVNCTDIAAGEEIAVPACMAFYGRTEHMPRVRLAYDTSNGCAIGTSVTEASLHGLLELIERDAFLMAWYRRMPLPDITKQLSRHERVRWILAKLTLLTGCEVRIFDSSVGFGVPTVICCVFGKSLPAQALAAGASLSYVDAACNALAELSGHWLFLSQRLSDAMVRRHAHALLENSEQVMTMEDHGFVNALPESRSRMEFLLHSADAEQNLRYSQAIIAPLDGVDASLSFVVQQLVDAGLRPIAARQHNPILKRTKLFCVKMICPGLLPMTFGHCNRRVASSRIGDQEQQLLAAKCPPHPFM
jgi:thiazole/oxazole-forming peptide maturase SagD family component